MRNKVYTVSITIREIRETDNSVLATIIRSCFIEFNAPQQGTVYSDPTTDQLYQYFNIEKAICWVAEVENNIVGCCGIYPTENLPQGYAELVKFYIHASARSRGIGKLLMNQCLVSAKQLGYSTIYLESLPHFKTAVSMYTKLGFTSLSNPLGNSGHTSCNIWMIKNI